ncbi:hypothetical protein JCM33374_g1883 [Metschnikowia sp. JCM 33374]|nr:hypothetical protein JCM33374_g1883 [Metschnikowia sp. JCM 33374]
MQLDIVSKISSSHNIARDMWSNDTPNAWDMCMQDSTCKGCAIAGIVLGSLWVCWVILVFILCFCLGYSFVNSLRFGYGGRGNTNRFFDYGYHQPITPHSYSQHRHNQAMVDSNFAHNQAIQNNMLASQMAMSSAAAGGASTGNTGGM